ncbi:MAG: DUF5615 family PIN-like protein [Leptolyngbyaceae cyanobacterium RM2_2_4]|nr:DUF5615 family PIN-like protein [Leptolyngbyaceae cyanobacterium SM1_4_3]NJN89314.1 DUF5615 family PIN-like protein [Leptolyngbyaceae cyanobacterium SL_5_14]NJO52704.1 DUF5615 family PIN-like protein [Leptolyngbyaceae cyanobacterium RM2_2_4]
MPERIRFHLDENVDPAIALGLRRNGIDVTTSQENNLLAESDTVQLDFARSQSRILVTHDDDFLIMDSQGIEHSGIVYCQKNTKSVGYLIRMLILLYEVTKPEEMKGRVEYL